MHRTLLTLTLLILQTAGLHALVPVVSLGAQPHRNATLSTPLAGGVVFEAHDDAHGFELWWTDGTLEGTKRLTDLNPGAADGVCEPGRERLFAHEDWAYFFGITGTTVDLWRTNELGEVELVQTLNTRCPDSTNLVVDGALRSATADLFVIAPASRTPGATPEAALWRVSLTSGLAEVPAFPAAGWWIAGIDTIWNGNVYVRLFNGSNRYGRLNEQTASFDIVVPSLYGAHASGSFGDRLILGGGRLYSSDGSAAGTFELTTQGTVSVGPGVVMDGIYYFPAALGGMNQELWRTDGTLPGTYVVRDFNSGFAGMAGAPMIFDGRLAFFREHYSSTSPSALYETDGTFEGTRAINLAMPSQTLYRSYGGPTGMKVVNGRMYVFASSAIPSASGSGAIWEITPASRSARQVSLVLNGDVSRFAQVNDFFLLQKPIGTGSLYSVSVQLFADGLE